MSRIRVVSRSAFPSTGAWMAVDAKGLRSLHELYALPARCRAQESIMHTPYSMTVPSCLTPIQELVGATAPPPPGIVMLPEGTRGESKGRWLLLSDGRLVEPYQASHADLEQHGAVEVERIRIQRDIPDQIMDGWIQIHSLSRVCCGF
jgi:hypothetical protein